MKFNVLTFLLVVFCFYKVIFEKFSFEIALIFSYFVFINKVHAISTNNPTKIDENDQELERGNKKALVLINFLKHLAQNYDDSNISEQNNDDSKSGDLTEEQKRYRHDKRYRLDKKFRLDKRYRYD
jgi:hypothetical protein